MIFSFSNNYRPLFLVLLFTSERRKDFLHSTNYVVNTIFRNVHRPLLWILIGETCTSHEDYYFCHYDIWGATYVMTKMPLSVTYATDTPKHPTNYNIRDLSNGCYFLKLLIFPIFESRKDILVIL
jgi:hypothetical protein